jgi:hypothetical protein
MPLKIKTTLNETDLSVSLPQLCGIYVYHKVWPQRHKVITKIPQKLNQFHPIPIQTI